MDVQVSRTKPVMFSVQAARRTAMALAAVAAIAVFAPGASSAAVTVRSGLRVLHAPSVIVAVSVLQYVQSQQLPSRHVRILLQFSGATPVRSITVGPTANYVLQFLGAITAPTVPNIIPVNLGSVQTISVTQLGNALAVSIAMFSPVQAKLLNGPGNLLIVDVPPGPFEQNNPLNYQGQQHAAAPTRATQTKIIRLRFADVSEIVGVLTGSGSIAPGNVFNPQPSQMGTQPQQGFTGPFNQGINQGAYGQTFQPFQQFGQYQQPSFGQTYSEQQPLGQRVSESIAVDRRLNAIILTGAPDQVAQAESLIRFLDIPVASILLDTTVLEVTETGAKSLGLPYNQSETSPLTHIFNTQAQIINNIPIEAVAGALAIQSDIFLLVRQGHARVLASPKILTQDGVAASILTGDSLPIRVTTPVGVGGVGAVSSQVEYINVGVNLQILPRITGAGGVDTSIYSQVSSVTGFTSSNDPQISTRQAQTKVNLMEGQTLVIGGLLQQRDIRNLQKIPILGDLPLVGALFRFYTQTKQNTNLVITVTPHVVPAPVIAPSGAATSPGTSP